MAVVECLTNVIGLSQKNCNCAGDKPGDWETINATKSGRYVENITFGVPVEITGASKDCDNNGPWHRLKDARKEGIDLWLDHYTTELAKLQKKNIGNLYGEVGQKKSNSPISIGSNFTGFHWDPLIYKGASWVITGGFTSFSSADPEQIITFYVVEKSDPTTPVHTFTNQVGVERSFTTSVKLPLSKNGKKLQYYVLAELNGAMPYNYEINCGCSGIPKPLHIQNNLATVQGVMSSSLAAIGSGYSMNSYTNGIILEYALECDGLEWMCQVEDAFWQTSDFGRVASVTMSLYSNLALCYSLLNNPGVNFTKLVNKEDIAKKATWIQNRLETMMPYLVKRPPEDLTDCFICDPDGTFVINIEEQIV